MSALGLSTAGLRRLQHVLAGYVERGELPGLVALTSRHSDVHVDAIGAQALGGDAPMRRDTIFRISSVTKPMAAAATMLLVEECRLRLDDPVDELTPELANRRVLRRLDAELDDTIPANRSITVRDLLTFRMGFGVIVAPPDSTPIQRAATELRLAQGPPDPTIAPASDEWVRRLGTLPLMQQPGEQWLYNTSADVLGVLVARASGQPVEQFLQERLFEPLGMRDTAFWVPREKLERFASAYQTSPVTGALTVSDAPAGKWSTPPAFSSLAGGLVSTVDDCHAFARMLLARGMHGNRRILSDASVALMTMDHLTPVQKAISGLVDGYFESHGWGFCMSVVTRRDELSGSVGTFGWDGGFGSVWYVDPREELITILMTQCAWTSPVPPNVARDYRTMAALAVAD